MATPDSPLPDLFQRCGDVREDLLTGDANRALRETIRLTRETRWDTVRSPHVFMGLLASGDAGILGWCERLRADPPRLLAQFQELFLEKEGEAGCPLALNREFLSDNVIRLLRDAQRRAVALHRCRVSPLDLLVCVLSAPNSVVAECFEPIGLTAARLTEMALQAEQGCASSPDTLS